MNHPVSYPGQYPGHHAPPPQKKGLGTGARIAIIVVVTVLVLGLAVGLFAVMGVRSYLRSAKAAEARNVLGQIGTDAVHAYEMSADASGKKHICPSSTFTVPASPALIKGVKYQPQPGEYMKDGPKAGFGCILFEMDSPQYYLYSYVATPTGFTATAQGDLDGDGVLSRFEIHGKLVGDSLMLDPTITEKDPDE
jgi:type IV pilus assembly protein PilA